MGECFFMESMIEVITDIEHEKVVITARDPGLLSIPIFMSEAICENVLLSKTAIRVPMKDKALIARLIMKDSSLTRLFAVLFSHFCQT
jgi:hypothetical protein